MTPFHIVSFSIIRYLVLRKMSLYERMPTTTVKVRVPLLRPSCVAMTIAWLHARVGRSVAHRGHDLALKSPNGYVAVFLEQAFSDNFLVWLNCLS